MAKDKAVNFELISDMDSEPYHVLKEMRVFHGDVDEAKIALAWRVNFKRDKDGHLVLGKCVKSTDLHKEFHPYDFVILLNREVWDSGEFTDEQKAALMDHELCHAAASEDKDGHPKYDERGRRVFRVREHDIEEFQAIVHRHGCYKKDLEAFAQTLLDRRNAPLLESLTAEYGTPRRGRPPKNVQ